MDLHDYAGQLKRIFSRIQEDPKISEENKRHIEGFRDHLLSEGIGVARIGRYMIDLKRYAYMLKKPFDKANEKDIRKVVGEVEQSELSAESKKVFKILMRKLYRYLRGITEKRVYPPEVQWISINISKKHSKLPEELLTEEEIKNIIQCCQNYRDKALLATIAESGCRVSEVGMMKIKHVTFEQYGARLNVNGKTGMRKVLVVNSTPYLHEWINQHPKNDEPEAYLWYNKTDKTFLSYARIALILKNAVKAAGIKKRVHLHLFRHSRATKLASTLSDSQLKNYLGWTQGSKMAGIYIHMSGKDTDDAILKANGIEVERKPEPPKLKPTNCIRCQTQNGATNKFCKLCGFVLDEEEAQKLIKKETERQNMDQLLTNLLKDKDVLGMLVSKVRNKVQTNI